MVNILNLYFFITIFLISYIIMFISHRGKALYIKLFAVLFFTILIYDYGYLMIINANNMEQIKFWNKFQYLAVPFISYTWLLATLLYTDNLIKIKSKFSFFLIIIPILTFFIKLTNDSHHLYYNSFEFEVRNGINILLIDNGIFYYIYQSFHLLVTLTIILINLKGYKTGEKIERQKYLISIIATIIPGISVILNIFKPFEIGIDYSAIFLPASVIILAIGITKYDFLDIEKHARNKIFENSEQGIIVLNRFMKIIDYNKSAKSFFSLINQELREDYLDTNMISDKELYEKLCKRERVIYYFKNERKERFFQIDTEFLTNKFHDAHGFVKYIRDITSEMKKNSELEYLAKTDELTKLNNRREFIEKSEKVVERARFENESISLILMDIDYFKSVNDNFGHLAGDVVINKIGLLIKDIFHSKGIDGRLGGEEFVVLLPKVDLDEAFEKAEELRKMVKELSYPEVSSDLNITMSIGVASVNEEYSLNDLLKRADKAMYISKSQGRNRTTKS